MSNKCWLEKLPDEILSCVFSIAVQDDLRGAPDANSMRNAILVNHRFRRVATHHLYRQISLKICSAWAEARKITLLRRTLEENTDVRQICRGLKVVLSYSFLLINLEALLDILPWLSGVQHLSFVIMDWRYHGIVSFGSRLCHGTRSLKNLSSLEISCSELKYEWGTLFPDLGDAMRGINLQKLSIHGMNRSRVASHMFEVCSSHFARSFYPRMALRKLTATQPVPGTGTFTDLSIKNIESEVFPSIVRWSHNLVDLDMEMPCAQSTIITTLSSVKRILAPNSRTLRTLRIRGLCPGNIASPLEGFDLRGFTALEELHLDASVTGSSILGVEDVLAPQLKLLVWNWTQKIDEEDTPIKIDRWVVALASTAVDRSASTRLRRIRVHLPMEMYLGDTVADRFREKGIDIVYEMYPSVEREA